MGRVFSDLGTKQSERERIEGKECGTVKGWIIHFGRNCFHGIVYLFCMECVRASYDGEVR